MPSPTKPYRRNAPPTTSVVPFMDRSGRIRKGKKALTPEQHNERRRTKSACRLDNSRARLNNAKAIAIVIGAIGGVCTSLRVAVEILKVLAQ